MAQYHPMVSAVLVIRPSDCTSCERQCEDSQLLVLLLLHLGRCGLHATLIQSYMCCGTLIYLNWSILFFLTDFSACFPSPALGVVNWVSPRMVVAFGNADMSMSAGLVRALIEMGR